MSVVVIEHRWPEADLRLLLRGRLSVKLQDASVWYRCQTWAQYTRQISAIRITLVKTYYFIWKDHKAHTAGKIMRRSMACFKMKATTQQPFHSFTAKWYSLTLLWCSCAWSGWSNWKLLPICHSCKNGHVGVSHKHTRKCVLSFYLHALSHYRPLHCLCDWIWLMALSPSGQFNFFHTQEPSSCC